MHNHASSNKMMSLIISVDIILLLTIESSIYLQ